MTTPEITLPIVHLNGTSAGNLFKDYLNAYEKLREAREALSAIEFNARDYYLKEGAWPKAREEMTAHHIALKKAEDHCLAVCEHVQQFIKE